ncbi:MAG: hypothetical protein OEW39_06415 [Deltaproteobacteria bacterium]|nr:hypothetical protein [Deltaproteobacteria bacterium]
MTRLAALLLLLGLISPPEPSQARELRRNLLFIRPMLMGEAYVALGDESSALFYNSAGIAFLGSGSVEIFTPQIAVDERLKAAATDPASVSNQYSGLTVDQLSQFVDQSAFIHVNLRMPVITVPSRGLAFAFGGDALVNLEVTKQGEITLPDPIGTLTLPALHVEVYADTVGAYNYTFRPSDGLALGFLFKAVNRIGIDKLIDAETLFGAALNGTSNLANDPDYLALQQNLSYTAMGLDVGLLYVFRDALNWHPRLGYSIINVGGYSTAEGFHGMRFGAVRRKTGIPIGGELPLLHTFGFAVSPVHNLIRYSIALDYVDVMREFYPKDSHWKMHTRLGFELGIGPKEDGTALLSIMAGLNAGHTSFGVLTRTWIMEVGFGRYTVERGNYTGDRPDSRRVVLLGFRY